MKIMNEVVIDGQKFIHNRKLYKSGHGRQLSTQGRIVEGDAVYIRGGLYLREGFVPLPKNSGKSVDKE